MRSILILAAMLIVFGTSMAKVADTMTSERAQAKAVDKSRAMNAFASVQPQTSGNAGRRSVTLSRDGRGHFQTDARVEGRRLGFSRKDVFVQVGARQRQLKPCGIAFGLY